MAWLMDAVRGLAVSLIYVLPLQLVWTWPLMMLLDLLMLLSVWLCKRMRMGMPILFPSVRALA